MIEAIFTFLAPQVMLRAMEQCYDGTTQNRSPLPVSVPVTAEFPAVHAACPAVHMRLCLNPQVLVFLDVWLVPIILLIVTIYVSRSCVICLP